MKNAVFLILVTSLLFASCKSKKETAFSVSKTIPYFTFYTLDNERFTKDSLDSNRVKFIIYFNSECDHCQKQGKWLSNGIELFKNYELIFVSHETKSSIKNYKNKFNLDLENITFIQDTRLTFGNKFGIDKFPSIIIYNKRGNLIKYFSGETKTEELLEAVK